MPLKENIESQSGEYWQKKSVGSPANGHDGSREAEQEARSGKRKGDDLQDATQAGHRSAY